MANPAIPIPLIQYSDTQFVVNPKATEILSAIHGPIAVIVVAGPYRTGKSYLLNCLINQHKNGFSVGKTVRACTKGIWLWGKPIQKNGVTYVFLDSEGIGSINQNQMYDTQLFSLALLLSSLFVLNTRGTITESSLQQLELVVECTKCIRINEQKMENKYSQSMNNSSLAEYFPSFLWVLRDFMLELLDENNKPMTANEYLEHCLESNNIEKAHTQKKHLRNVLKSVFCTRDCVPLVRPILDEKKLQNLNTVPWQCIRKEFRTQMDSLRRMVFQNAKPKKLNGAFVSGTAFCKLATAYANALNQGAIPVINTAWQSVIKLETLEAIDAAITYFQNKWNKQYDRNVAYNSEELTQLFEIIKIETINLLRNRFLGNEENCLRTENKLTKKLMDMHMKHMKHNESRSKKIINALLQQLWQQSEIKKKINQYQNLQEIERDYTHIWQQFTQKSKGPTKDIYKLGRTFFETKVNTVRQNLFEKMSENCRIHEADIIKLKEEKEDLMNKQKQILKKGNESTNKMKIILKEKNTLLCHMKNQEQQLKNQEHQLNDRNQQLKDQCLKFDSLKVQEKKNSRAIIFQDKKRSKTKI